MKISNIGGYRYRPIWKKANRSSTIPGPVLMIGRSDHTAGIIRDKQKNEATVVVVGGVCNGTVLDSVEVLNLKSGHAWTQGWFTVPRVVLKI